MTTTELVYDKMTIIMTVYGNIFIRDRCCASKLYHLSYIGQILVLVVFIIHFI